MAEGRRKIMEEIQGVKEYLIRGGVELDNENQIEATMQIQELLIEENDVFINDIMLKAPDYAVGKVQEAFPDGSYARSTGLEPRL